MKRTQHSGCFIFLTELDWLNFALDTGADFHWLNTEQLYLDVLLYSNTGIEKFSWGWISIRIRYSTNGKVNIRIQRMRIFFRFVTSLHTIITFPVVRPKPNYTAWWQRHMRMHNLPRVVTRHWNDQELNLQPFNYECNALTTQLPSNCFFLYDIRIKSSVSLSTVPLAAWNSN